jgi:rhamnosyltransferase
MAQNNIKATIFIPTYNGEKYLSHIFNQIFSQRVTFAYEVLVIDSGSKDSSLEIIKKFQSKHPNLRLHEIPNSEFGHGKTRNLAAQMSKGEIVVYLSHDAIPAHDRWLYEMVKPFAISNQIVGVIGKQIPRNNCIPMLKTEIRGVFSGLGSDIATTLYYNDDFAGDDTIKGVLSFYSDVNSAARRELLTGDLPYKDVRYAEDQLFGIDLIDAGFIKAYAPRASVIHSNDLKLDEYKHRMFDETIGLRKVGFPIVKPSKKAIIKSIVRGSIRDSRNILRDGQYSFKRKLYWLVFNPLYHIEKWRGVTVAADTELQDNDVANNYSLEKRNLR